MKNHVVDHLSNLKIFYETSLAAHLHQFLRGLEEPQFEHWKSNCIDTRHALKHTVAICREIFWRILFRDCCTLRVIMLHARNDTHAWTLLTRRCIAAKSRADPYVSGKRWQFVLETTHDSNAMRCRALFCASRTRLSRICLTRFTWVSAFS